MPSVRRCVSRRPFSRAPFNLPCLATGFLGFHLSALVCQIGRSFRQRSRLDLSIEDITTACGAAWCMLARRLLPKCPLLARRAPCSTPLLGFYKDRPSVDIGFMRPLPDCRLVCVESFRRSHRAQSALVAALRRMLATALARSVLAVSRGFDGFLRMSLCGFVAPRYRP